MFIRSDDFGDGATMTATHTAKRADAHDKTALAQPATAATPASAPPSPVGADSPSDGDCGHSPATPPQMTREHAVAVADVFKVLADPTRVLMLEALRESGELCVLHLADAIGMSQSAVSHNLRLLRQAGLVTRRRDGHLVYYRPDDDHVTGLVSLCGEHAAHQERGIRA
ncbi:MAG: ArsR/SmtB family transcription factor [Thermoleophilia bacterium]